jgi:hypothetical protein
VGSSQRMRSTHLKRGLSCAILCSSEGVSNVVFCTPCATAYLRKPPHKTHHQAASSCNQHRAALVYNFIVTHWCGAALRSDMHL